MSIVTLSSTMPSADDRPTVTSKWKCGGLGLPGLVASKGIDPTVGTGSEEPCLGSVIPQESQRESRSQPL
jgi:hypothetical protein